VSHDSLVPSAPSPNRTVDAPDPRLAAMLARVNELSRPPIPPAWPRAGQTDEDWRQEIVCLRAAHRAHAEEVFGTVGPRPAYQGSSGVDHTVPVDGDSVIVRVYEPNAAPAPLVVHLHGGGFWSGGGQMGLNAAAPTLGGLRDALGVCVADVDYRTAPEHRYPIPLNDCADAVDWMIGHAQELGADPNRMVFVGASAGAQLAAGMAQLATRRGWPPVRRLVLVAPPLDALMTSSSVDELAALNPGARELLTNAWDLYLPRGQDRRDPLVSPIYTTEPGGFPPTFIAADLYDPLRDDARRFAERLRSGGTSVDYREYPMGHAVALPETTAAVATDLVMAIQAACFA
jgi:acetyl esterase